MRLPAVFREPSARKARSRRSYAAGWIRLRKTIQVLALITFLMLFLAARWPGSPLRNWSGLFLKLDPLAGLATWLHSQGEGVWTGVEVALWLGLITIGLTLLAGRAWCGWLCPLGTLLDWITPQREGRTKRRSTADQYEGGFPLLEHLRTVKTILLFILLFSALMGSLAWMVLDPLTLLERTLSHSLWPALNWVVTGLESTLYRLWPGSGEALVWFESWARPGLLPDVPVPRAAPFLFTAVFGAVIALNWIAPRFWCRYLCPLGGMLGLLSKVAVLRRQVKRDEPASATASDHSHCTACQLCSIRCPTGTIDPQNDFTSDPAECTLCLDCLDACPRSATYFAPRFQAGPRLPYDPDRRVVLTSLGTAVLTTALFGSGWLRLREHPARLRPPGVAEDPASDGGDMPGCIRCGVCLQACPTSGLQPALNEAGLEGLWTPVLTPRLGYCDYSCNACGQACPVGAIPALSLEEKRVQVIGSAYIDKDRCLAWADGIPCIVCEEMCPLPEKAITWDEGVSVPGGEVLQRPVVDREKCIGCGICEYKCPLPGPAAIRVWVS